MKIKTGNALISLKDLFFPENIITNHKQPLGNPSQPNELIFIQNIAELLVSAECIKENPRFHMAKHNISNEHDRFNLDFGFFTITAISNIKNILNITKCVTDKKFIIPAFFPLLLQLRSPQF